MTTFDLAEVREFAASLDARMARCQNGEGMECATLEVALQFHANLCCEFSDRVRQWGREVFAGRVEFDPEVEVIWLAEGARLHSRAMDMLALSRGAETPCYILEGQRVLLPALWNLHRLLKGWVTPKLAVGPSARQGLTPDHPQAEEARRRVAALPALPADWKPDDPQQQAMYRMLRTS
jgi:hypothetical protein